MSTSNKDVLAKLATIRSIIQPTADAPSEMHGLYSDILEVFDVMEETIQSPRAHHQTGGRTVQEHSYYPYTFATGVTVYYRKVSGSALRELPKALRKEPEFRKPEPPIDQTDLGPMPNEDHPAYLAALKEWQERFNMELSLRSAKLIIAMAVQDDAIDVEDTRRTLAQMAKYGGIDISGYDLNDPDDLKVAYVLYIALADEDSKEFIGSILNKSMVTAEAVQEKVDTFQSDAGRSVGVPLPNVPVGAEL